MTSNLSFLDTLKSKEISVSFRVFFVMKLGIIMRDRSLGPKIYMINTCVYTFGFVHFAVWDEISQRRLLQAEDYDLTDLHTY